MKLIIAPIAAILCCIILVSLLAVRFSRCRSLRNSQNSETLMNEHPRVSYVDLARATEGFSPTNLIGDGSFGSVYKGFIRYDGKATSVAVKVLNLQQHHHRVFLAECQALRHVRHRNLVKILTVCSGFDSAGNDFKALVYEFIPNGNMDEWLHMHNPSRRDGKETLLDINQRISIAIDVASALD
jgi:serine/threonine protein kinase